ncbi:MAG: hypothetical protein GX603_07195 [Chloroflexi bacterium]|nr:hypothetical protein [Chloroflexota bacterium]
MEQKNAFEEKLLSGYNKPEPDPGFLYRLEAQLKQNESGMESQKTKRSFRWAYAFAPLMVLLILFFAVGPNKVVAQLQSWFNFVPGLGVVENPAGIRIVSEPVYQTQDGVTVGIKSGLITPDQANFEVDLIDVPIEAMWSYNPGEPVCDEMSYLLLPDGSKIFADAFQFGIPAEVTEATYVIPCIDMRTRGKAPENWELPLKFVAAPEDMETFAITFPDPNVKIEQTKNPEIALIPGKANENIQDILEVLQVVEKPNSWLLTLSILHEHLEEYIPLEQLQIVDANGVRVSYSIPEVDEWQALDQSFRMKYDYMKMWDYAAEDQRYYSFGEHIEIAKNDYVFPLIITNVYNRETLDLSVERNVELFSFDVEGSPQVGDRIEINKTLQLGENELYVDYAEVDTRAGWGGYSIHVDGGDKISDAMFILLDYPSNKHAGGIVDRSVRPFQFASMSLLNPVPTGHIRVGLAQEPSILLEVVTTRATWSPPAP